MELHIRDDIFINSPFVVAAATVFGCLIWLLAAAPVAGEAAARDVETGMHPLTYTAPISKAGYLGGRFLAAFVLNALILLAEHRSGASPLATSLDLYRELQAVTPDSLQPLLHDLFEANTFWKFDTERATAAQTEAGTWQVTLDVRARKVVVDGGGVETEVPMDDWVKIAS